MTFGKDVAKNRALGNSTIFHQQFFSISGGGDVPCVPPWRRLWSNAILNIMGKCRYQGYSMKNLDKGIKENITLLKEFGGTYTEWNECRGE